MADGAVGPLEHDVAARTEVPAGTGEERLVDADRFLAFTQRLKEARAHVEASSITGSRRSTWHEQLIAIADEAQEDLDRAEAHLERFEAELARHG